MYISSFLHPHKTSLHTQTVCSPKTNKRRGIYTEREREREEKIESNSVLK